MEVETPIAVGKVDPGLREPDVKLDLDTVYERSAQLEALGFDGLVHNETKEDPFVVLPVAAQATRRVSLTPAVAIAFPRSPTVTALSAWTLQRLARGRFILGLGTQVRGHIQRRFGMTWSPAGPWIRDYIAAVRAVWDTWQNGTRLDFHSQHYNLTLMVPLFNPGAIDYPHIPIHIAAVNRYMCQVAGEVADGLRPHPICTRKYIAEVMLPALRKGAEKAGRSADRLAVCVNPLLVTAPDASQLAVRRENVRARLAFYASTPAYRAVFDTHGWTEVAERLSALSKQQRWEEMPAHMTDDMVETMAVVGTYDQIAERVWRRYEGLATRTQFGIPIENQGDMERLGHLVRALQQGFGSR